MDPAWSNTTVLAGDTVDAVTRLKHEVDGEIVIPASHRLGRTLIAHGLVDEIRLVLFLVVLGIGERFFAAGDARSLRLAGVRRVGEGLVLLTYGLSAPAPTS